MVHVDNLQLRLESLLGIPATTGNEVTLFRNGDQIFPAMLDAIRSAQRSVDLLTYVYWSGWPAEAFARALSERAEHGCRVRVLIDAIGGAQMDRDLADQMRAAGVRVELFRPPWLRSPFTHNHRTHRKVLVVDGRVGFTGGVGIAEEWQGDARNADEWRDSQIRILGPAVAGLRGAFAQNWAETVGAPDDPAERYRPLEPAGDDTLIVVRGTATLGWDDIQTAWHTLLTSANDRITLATAYFAPDAPFLHLLQKASLRGVRVQLLLPGPEYDKAVSRIASERHFEALVDAGVEVWRYQPTMLHLKVVTIDRDVAMIGSSNFNRRSMEHDEEVACIILGGRAPHLLAADFDNDLARAKRLNPSAWRNRPTWQRLAEGAVRPLSRFL